MIQSHVRKSRWPTFIGFTLQIVGVCMWKISQSTGMQLAGAACYIVGTAFLYKALKEYALALGRDSALGWLAVLSLFGLLIVATREDLTGERVGDEGETSDKPQAGGQ
jgi:hypothetical protein